jgi:ribosomal-protein-alanine N-acetyltransferase
VTATEISYEPLSRKNLPEVLAIESVSFPEPWSRFLFLKEIDQPSSYFMVFRLDSEVIGYGGFWLVADEAHITNIAVHPLYRRQGYGSMILQHLLDAAISKKATMATLEVRQSNLAALNMYRKFKFRQVAIQKGYYAHTGENATVMVNDDLAGLSRE